MTKQPNIKPHILVILFISLLVACVPQTPIPIYITPTPQATADSQGVDSSPVPTVENISIPTVDVAIVPTMSVDSTDDVDSTDAPSPAPNSTIIGAIIDEDYELPPTNTPRPTETPLSTDTPPPSATPFVTDIPDLPALNRNDIGLQLYYNMDVSGWDATLGMTQQTRVGWVKMQVDWGFMQPNGPTDFDQTFRLFQLHVQEADKRGFRVLLSIAKAPKWARITNQNESGPPDDPQVLANFINFLLDKLGPNIDAIEVWNEPNLIREWTGRYPLNGSAYMELFRPAYDAIRAYSQDIVIVTAGLAPAGTNPGIAVDDRVYLQQMYDAGLANYQDVVVGIHPYSWGNPPDARCCNAVEGRGWDDDPHFFFSETVETYREITLNNGHDTQLWSTEFGWATWEGYPTDAPEVWMTYNTPDDQMNYTLRAFEIGQERDYMGPMFLWNLNFANEIVVGQQREIAAYSLLFPGFDTGQSIQERPLYWAIAQLQQP